MQPPVSNAPVSAPIAPIDDRSRPTVMKQFITALSPRAEMAIVLLCAFAFPLVYTALIALKMVDLGVVTDARLLRIVAFELVILTLIGWVLWTRGWTLDRIGIRAPVFQDVLDGVGLLVVAYLIPAALQRYLPAEMTQNATDALSFAPLSLPLVIVTSVVNPVFEEVFVVGYVFAAFGESNRMLALNVSVALRVAYHLSQGPAAVIFILPMAIVFAWWYSTRPSLWPLLLAHIGLDLIGLAQYTG